MARKQRFCSPSCRRAYENQDCVERWKNAEPRKRSSTGFRDFKLYPNTQKSAI